MSLYETLGVPVTASQNDIKIAFRKSVLVTHPDKGGSKDLFNAVMMAFEVLSDQKKRALYDGRVANARRKRKAQEPSSVDGSWKKKTFAGYCATSAPRWNNENGQSSTDFDHYPYCEKLWRLLCLLPSESRRKSVNKLTMQQKGKLESFASRAKKAQNAGRGLPKDALAEIPEEDSSVDDSSDEWTPHKLALEDGHDVSDFARDNDSSDESGPSALNEERNHDPGIPHLDDARVPWVSCCGRYSEPAVPEPRSIEGRRQTSCRGIHSTPGGRYRANCGFGLVFIETRPVKELSRAVDHLMFLHSLKRNMSNVPASEVSHRFKAGIVDALKEHHALLADLDMVFHIGLPMIRSTSGNFTLRTPRTRDLDSFVMSWQTINPSYGILRDYRVKPTECSAAEFEVCWDNFETNYLDVFAQTRCRANAAGRLKVARVKALAHCQRGLERIAESAAFRQDDPAVTCIERWNSRRMAAEESWTRRYLRSRRRILSRITNLIHQWHVKQTQHEIAKAREKKHLSNIRWKAMNRRDLTWAEVRERRWGMQV